VLRRTVIVLVPALVPALLAGCGNSPIRRSLRLSPAAGA
jgi:hypothetical protein